MKDFRIEAVAQTELEDAAVWYESQRDGLGLEFIAEVDRVLRRIAHEGTFVTAPIATIEGGDDPARQLESVTLAESSVGTYPASDRSQRFALADALSRPGGPHDQGQRDVPVH